MVEDKPQNQSSNIGTKKPVKRLQKPRKPPKYETVLFCPYTPGSKLKKNLQETEDLIMGDKQYCRVRMVERAGPSIGSLIHNKVFWSKEACGRPHCRPCKTKAGSCRPVNVTYRVRCSECLKKGIKAHYVGEPYRSLLDRALEHEAAVRSNAEGNAMAKHAMEFHPEMEEEKPVFTYEVMSS